MTKLEKFISIFVELLMKGQHIVSLSKKDILILQIIRPLSILTNTQI